MTKCSLCQQRRAKRFCAALDRAICPTCCGSKRQREIECFGSCEYLKSGEEYHQARFISKLVAASFTERAEDVFDNPEVVQFVAPLEHFFVEEFYESRGVNDSALYDALSAIYSYQTGAISELAPKDECQRLIFAKYQEIDRNNPNIDGQLKALAVLRVLKSIRNSSGGILGSRNYLGTIYSQFHHNGKWSHLFSGGIETRD